MKRHFFNPRTFLSDGIAGLTLGIESIPDAMASALLAAVNPIHGVYAVMLATPIGALFASSVFMSVQTTSAMSLIVASVPQVQNEETGTASLLALALLIEAFKAVLSMYPNRRSSKFVKPLIRLASQGTCQQLSLGLFLLRRCESLVNSL